MARFPVITILALLLAGQRHYTGARPLPEAPLAAPIDVLAMTRTTAAAGKVLAGQQTLRPNETCFPLVASSGRAIGVVGVAPIGEPLFDLPSEADAPPGFGVGGAVLALGRVDRRHAVLFRLVTSRGGVGGGSGGGNSNSWGAHNSDVAEITRLVTCTSSSDSPAATALAGNLYFETFFGPTDERPNVSEATPEPPPRPTGGMEILVWGRPGWPANAYLVRRLDVGNTNEHEVRDGRESGREARRRRLVGFDGWLGGAGRLSLEPGRWIGATGALAVRFPKLVAMAAALGSGDAGASAAFTADRASSFLTALEACPKGSCPEVRRVVAHKADNSAAFHVAASWGLGAWPAPLRLGGSGGFRGGGSGSGGGGGGCSEGAGALGKHRRCRGGHRGAWAAIERALPSPFTPLAPCLQQAGDGDGAMGDVCSTEPAAEVGFSGGVRSVEVGPMGSGSGADAAYALDGDARWHPRKKNHLLAKSHGGGGGGGGGGGCCGGGGIAVDGEEDTAGRCETSVGPGPKWWQATFAEPTHIVEVSTVQFAQIYTYQIYACDWFHSGRSRPAWHR